jgi:ATPase subunit of ABC transporter with duplicated ATPase domains
MYILNQEVLKDASWQVKTGDRIGLVGANGCGKSTQLKILAGEMEPTSGEIAKSSSNLRVSVFKQEYIEDVDPKRTLKDELFSVFGRGVDVVREIAQFESRLSLPEVQEDPEKMQAILDKLADLQNEAEDLDASRFESQVERVIDQMGFTSEDRDALVETFSGGWKMRIGLGKILLQDPNILLLDEPTNHLDLETVEWMENFLREQKLPMVIVSHDREFLDRVCTKIVETIDGVTYSYDGDYSTFLEQKEKRWENWQAAYDAQQKKIKLERKWITTNKADENKISQVKARQVELDKLLASEDYLEKPPNKVKRFFFRFPVPSKQVTDSICSIQGVTHGYGGKTLFEGVDLAMDPSDRVAFIGPNGAGKSTLFRILMGEEEPDEGTVWLNEALQTSYYAQQTVDSLDLDDTVLGVVSQANSELTSEELRALLGKFLFKGDDIEKRIKSLSGGEKARVALCRMMMKPSSLLVLDEPTNHLDIPAKEILEEALQHYGGSVLLVSHDRYFLSKVATAICAFEKKHVEVYHGDYSRYLREQPEYQKKVQDRYKKGVSREIERAKVLFSEEQVKHQKKKKNFGGKGASGNKNKGVKNAKRDGKR